MLRAQGARIWFYSRKVNSCWCIISAWIRKNDKSLNIFCKIPSFSSTNLQSAEPLTRIQFSWVVETNGQAIQTASPHLHPTFVITPVCCCQKLHLHQGISTARTYEPTSFTEGSLSSELVPEVTKSVCMCTVWRVTSGINADSISKEKMKQTGWQIYLDMSNYWTY